MYYSLIALLFLAGIVYVQGQCPPKQQDIQMIIKYLERALESVKSKWIVPVFDRDDHSIMLILTLSPTTETKPGTDTRDADFVVNKVAKDIVNSKKYAPCMFETISFLVPLFADR